MTSHELANLLLRYPETKTVQFSEKGKTSTTIVMEAIPIWSANILLTNRPNHPDECVISCIHLNG